MGQNKAKGLLCIAPRKTMHTKMRAALMGVGFHQQSVTLRQAGQPRLMIQPVGNMGGQTRPIATFQSRQNAIRELQRGCEFRAHECCNFRPLLRAWADLNHQFAHALIAHDLPPDEETVTLAQLRGKVFFNLAQRCPAAPFGHAHFQPVGFDNRANILADARRTAWISQS